MITGDDMRDDGTHHYVVHGLVVRSTIALPGLMRTHSAGPPDLSIDRRPDLARSAPDERVVASVATPEGTENRSLLITEHVGVYTLRFGDVAVMRFDPRTRELDVDCPDRGVEPWLVVGPALAFVAEIGGALVVHATTVTTGFTGSTGSTGLALFAPSGRGKTSAALLLCSTGAELVAEDATRCSLDATHRPTAAVGPGLLRSRLAPELVAELLGAGTHTSVSGDARTLVAPRHHRHDVRLAGVIAVALEPDRNDVRLDPLDRTSTITLMLASGRVPGLVDPLLLERRLDAIADLAAQVDGHVLRIPWHRPPDRALAHNVADCLSSHLGL